MENNILGKRTAPELLQAAIPSAIPLLPQITNEGNSLKFQTSKVFERESENFRYELYTYNNSSKWLQIRIIIGSSQEFISNIIPHDELWAYLINQQSKINGLQEDRPPTSSQEGKIKLLLEKSGKERLDFQDLSFNGKFGLQKFRILRQINPQVKYLKLGACKQLRDIGISNFVAELKLLKNLKILDLNNNKVEEQYLEELFGELPNVEIQKRRLQSKGRASNTGKQKRRSRKKGENEEDYSDFEHIVQGKESQQRNEDIENVINGIPMAEVNKFLLGNKWKVDANPNSLKDFYDNLCAMKLPAKVFTQYNTPFEIFSLFFNTNTIQKLVDQTNIYHQQQKSKYKVVSKSNRWSYIKNCDSGQLKGFLGVLILMGIDKKPAQNDYWSSDTMIGNQFLRTHFSRNTYEWFKTNFHLEDNEKAGDKVLHKVNGLLKHVCKISQQLYRPEQHLALDEAMVRFYGRSKMKYYMPPKPTKWGLKIHCLNESDTGYVLDCKIDKGFLKKKHSLQHLIDKLTRNYGKLGHIIHMDNFYSTPQIFWSLKERGIGANGTIKGNRRFLPKEFKNDVESAFVSENGLACYVWKHVKKSKKKDKFVRFLSTVYSREVELVNKVESPKPYGVLQYNKNKNGVDVFDQLRSYYAFHGKCYKWWFAVFIFLLETVTINSYILYKKNGGKLSHKYFRLELSKGLMQELTDKKRKLPVPPPKVSTFGKSKHIIVKTGVQKKCLGCKKGTTLYRCSTCLNRLNNYTPLHPECFFTYTHQ